MKTSFKTRSGKELEYEVKNGKLILSFNGKEFDSQIFRVEGKMCFEVNYGMSVFMGIPTAKSNYAIIPESTDIEALKKEIENSKKELEKQREAEKQERIEDLRKSGKLLYILRIGGDSHTKELGVGYKIEDKKIKAGYKEEYGEKLVSTIKSEQIKVNINYNDFDFGYTIGGFFGEVAILTKEQYKTLIEQNQNRLKEIENNRKVKEEKKNKEYNDKLEEAKETGKPVLLYSCSVDEDSLPRNQREEESDIAFVNVYINPDGSKTEKIDHAY